MKWRSRLFLKDRLGEKRTVNKFLWYPRYLGQTRWRWLERAQIVEEIREVDIGGSMQWGYYSYEWRERGFVDNDNSS